MCAGGNLARFAVADVAGHGQSAGELSGQLRRLMRKHINTVNQTRFARALNGEFNRLAEAGLFATALLSTYHAPSDNLVVCNAGHPPPIRYRVRDRKWVTIEPDSPDNTKVLRNLPLGIIEPTEYQQFAVKLDPGDVVVMYTDSLIEAKDPKGELLGLDGLIALAAALDPSDPGAFKRELLHRVADFRGHAPADDDVTLIILHHNGSNPKMQSLPQMARTVGKLLGLVKV
jgi:serine phosphatase RsbU (regulator of sigma subunit)